MARPKPTILAEHIDQKTYISEQILDAEAIYAVLYKGKPFNLRTQHHLISTPTPKYLKTSFPNKGHCFNLADRLNKKFNVTDFQVFELRSGIPVTE